MAAIPDAPTDGTTYSLRATLSTQDVNDNVNDIMTSYWHQASRSILSPLPTGDLYNTDTQQMMLYVPATNHLEVFFKPQDNTTPKQPRFVEVKLD
ncbi:hypothetical protein [uncultured Thiodictyon sp.]|uniref:hypothetical protein n=1 Tax=uncultured Thiodictyon sp. TaxID=1846217 RepID=UPI0025D2DB21|nr:hypothetical protein [uncultured Thiodictyon sp.]